MVTLHEGDRISNYILEARLGSGSFGEVWRARHHVFGDRVAIKIPTDPQYVRNLQREGVAIHGLRHPNIVRAIDLDPYADPPYFVMELVNGPSLRELIDRHKATFPIAGAEAILRGILGALTAAHAAGLVHRDLKPANVLLHEPPDEVAKITEQAVRVTDFGLGHVGGNTTQSIMQSGSMETETGRSIAGTLAYMSPEQKTGEPIDARSDLYACGIILFEMLTGERPAGSEVPSALRHEVPALLDDVFQRCYARLDRRFSSAKEVLQAMADVPGSTPTAIPVHAFGAWRRCPICAQAVEAEDQFCINCGRQLAASAPRCPACSGFVHPKDRFCIFCGKDLSVLTA